VLLAVVLVFSGRIAAQNDDDQNVYKTQVPPGMELQQVGKKPSYRVVLPKGTEIQREGDLRIIEGPGEYSARKFVEYDARLDKMKAEIELLREEIAAVRNEIAESKRDTLASK